MRLLSPYRAITGIQTIKIATVAVNRNPVAAIPKGQMRKPNGFAGADTSTMDTSIGTGAVYPLWRFMTTMLTSITPR